jgi:hypothetical protein
MNKKLIVWLIAAAMIMGCMSFASGEEPETTSGGGISVPETPQLPPENPQTPPGAEPPGPEEPWIPSDPAGEEYPKIPSETEDPEDPETPNPEGNAPEEEVAPEEDLIEEDIPEDTIPDNDPVLHVTVPQTLDFVIDPFESGGRGQVYSDARMIENRGDADVLLTFSDISVVFDNGADIEAMRAPFDVYGYNGPARKALYLLLDFGTADTAPLILTDEAARANPPSILLRAAGSEGDACALNLSGIVNCDTDAGWRDGDVKISLNYLMEVIPLPEEPDAEAPDVTYQGGS